MLPYLLNRDRAGHPITGAGRLRRAEIVDTSWFNRPALPVAMTDTIVPDFPLSNKSFNRSYAGRDLQPAQDRSVVLRPPVPTPPAGG